MIWKYIKAAQFFPKYCPSVKAFKHKVRGKSGRGNRISFTEDEKRLIRAGIKKMLAENISKIGK